MSATPTETPALSGGEARRAARNAGAIAAARILSSGALFGWQLILGRALGESGFGVYQAVSSLFAIGAPITMGMIVIRDVARRPDSAGRYLSAALVIQTALALLAYVGINAGALSYDEMLRAYVAIAGLSLFIDLFGNLAYDQLLAQERMVWTSTVELLHIGARIGLAGLALWAGYGLLGVYAATLFTGIGRSAGLWALLLRTGVRPVWRVDWGIARPLLINSAPLALAAVINITYARIDTLLTAGLLSDADAGHLGAAMVIIYGVVDILNTTILIAVYPMMSRAFRSDGDNATFRFMVEKLAFFTLLIGVGIGLIFTLFSADIVVPLFGANYRATADVLRALIWYAALTMVANVFAQSLMVQNRQRRLVLVRAVGLAIKLALSLLLLPRVGVIGAALASAGAELLVLAALSASFGLNWGTLIPRLIRLAAVAFISALAMAALGALHPLVGMAGALVYALGVVILFSPDEWDLLYRMIAAAPGGAIIRKYWKRDVELRW